jgi:hypothetical protein
MRSMAKQPPKRVGGGNRKPTRMVRIRELLAKQLDKLTEKNASDFTEEVNRAVRMLLASEGLWPPQEA